MNVRQKFRREIVAKKRDSTGHVIGETLGPCNHQLTLDEIIFHSQNRRHRMEHSQHRYCEKCAAAAKEKP